ncbi:MAG: cobalamin biosynthesis protein CbiK [Deltaproteobacteria bacterium]|nr:cobalamin biosynthesis protein CbiK [Deltaproteobacteria bacterium]
MSTRTIAREPVCPVRGARPDPPEARDPSSPAVLIVAFGTSTRASLTFSFLDRELCRRLPAHEIRWAYASDRIRKQLNAAGSPETRLRSVPEALAELQADGFTRVVVQPLYVVPGEMYDRLLATVAGFPGLRTEVGGTLLHRWDSVHRLIGALAQDFLPPEEGCNVLVAHGTPSTASGANAVYLGLERTLARRHPNTYLGMVEGLVPPDDTLTAALTHAGDRVRFIPLMVVAGDHVMNDVMGENGEKSWRSELEAAGKRVEVPTVRLGDAELYRGLGFVPEAVAVFVDEIRRAMARL